jgi:hypothetical protein
MSDVRFELRNEVGGIDWAVYIDGKFWKRFPGDRKLAEYRTKEMCKRKTLETGKAWTVQPIYW